MPSEKKPKNSVTFGNIPEASSSTQIILPARNKTTNVGNGSGGGGDGKLDRSLKHFEIDGIKKMLDAKTKCGKGFWLSLILIATTITVYEVVKSVSDYYNSPTVTTYKIVTREKMDFPQIYICPNNVVRKSYLKKNPDKVSQAMTFRQTAIVKGEIKNRNKRNVLFNGIDLDEGFEQLNLISSQSVITRLTRASDQSDDISNRSAEYMTKILMEMSVVMEEFLIGCMFYSNNNSFINLPCSKITKEVLDPNYGKCFLIDVGDDQKQVVAGQGLSLIINLNSDEYPDDKVLFVRYFGVYLNVAKKFEPTSFERLLIPAKTYSNVAIRGQHLQFMKVKSGPQKQLCNDENDFISEILNVSYSRAACQMDCFLRQVIERCNCILTLDEHFVNRNVRTKYNYCTLNETLTCVQENVTNSEIAINQIQKCSDDCHIPCDSWKFQMKVSSMPLNKLVFEKNLPNGTKLDDIIHLQLAFPYLEYEEFTQDESVSISSLIANIGGQIGLWVGASMLTIIQIPITLFTLTGWQFFTKATPAIKEAGRRFTSANL